MSYYASEIEHHKIKAFVWVRAGTVGHNTNSSYNLSGRVRPELQLFPISNRNLFRLSSKAFNRQVALYKKPLKLAIIWFLSENCENCKKTIKMQEIVHTGLV